ncbi:MULTISPECIES: pyrroloquinoline-quinone synthase PqqC [unclassified Amycolatopsis]|uniref:pyrroloquinoline-quinone synthase PqqC n=1 Tax=unclassified Amycolatopsis TaxID=2618356 RepID=UPI00106ECF1B|nr:MULTISPECIES: pyrroloquinoline-quinone synthase PqqC [unclassified Amycolatopsis]
MSVRSAEEFEAYLRSIGEKRYHHLHPFNERMHAGELSEAEFRGWVRNRFYYQMNLPKKDAFILTKLPGRDDRRRWITRITDHDGRTGDEGGLEKWVRLGKAVGLSREELYDVDTVLPGVRFAVDAYVDFCRQKPWLEAVASALTELFAPDLLSRRITDVRRHYPWIATEGLDYFRARLTQQPKDIAHLLELVVENAKTEQQQEACGRALEFKCDVLWSLLDAVELAYRKSS